MSRFFKWFSIGWYQFLVGILFGGFITILSINTASASKYVHSCEYRELQTEKEALACNIYFESRSEGTLGMLAVGQVTLNRLDTNRYPNSVVEVVYQPSQFSWTKDGLSDRVYDVVAWRKSLRLSSYLLKLNSQIRAITDVTMGSLYYHTIRVSPYWASQEHKMIVIGDHVFYKDDLKK